MLAAWMRDRTYPLRRTQSFYRADARDSRVPRALRSTVSSLPEPPLPRALHNGATYRPRSQELRHHRRGGGRHLHRAPPTPAHRCRLGPSRARWRSREVLEREKPRRWRAGHRRHLLSQAGKASVGVARQYCGALGKRANCQVVVSAEYVAEEPESPRPLHWPVSGRLYLPEEWANDRERRGISHVPGGVIFRSKPNVALSLVDLSREWGVPFEMVVADSGYGKYPS